MTPHLALVKHEGQSSSVPAPLASLALTTCFPSVQDENDNPPTFSKPAYFVSVVENIMAGTGPGDGGGCGGRRPAGTPVTSLVICQPAAVCRAPTMCRHCAGCLVPTLLQRLSSRGENGQQSVTEQA